MLFTVFNHIDDKFLDFKGSPVRLLIERVETEEELINILKDNLKYSWKVDPSVSVSAMNYISSLVQNEQDYVTEVVHSSDLNIGSGLIVTPIGKEAAKGFKDFSVKFVDIIV